MKAKLNNSSSALQLKKRHEEKMQMLGECYMLFRPNDFPMYLKPKKSRQHTTCSLSQKAIYPGDFVYPCHENPVRLTSNGNAKVLIVEALKAGDKILPDGYYPIKLPTTENLISLEKIQRLKKQQQSMLEKQATKLLREHS